MPPPQDLADHWERCETVINGLGMHVSANTLSREVVRNLAPFLLGAPVWSAVREETFDSWVSLRAVVERRFGLTTDQVQDAFFSMRPAPGESSA